MAGAGSRDRTATNPITRVFHSWDIDVPSLQPPGTCNTQPGHTPQHCLGPWPWHGWRVAITRGQAFLEGSNHPLPQFPFLVLACLTSRGYSQHQLGVAHPLTPTTTPCHRFCSHPRARHHRGHWERLLCPGHASLTSPGPAPIPGLMMDKPAPPGAPSQGALEKQPRPGTRPVGMDGSELGAHACDHPPVCERTPAHRWMFLHTRAFPAAHALVHASVSTHSHTHTCSHTQAHKYVCVAWLQCTLSAP